MIRVFRTGKHAHRSPFAYAALAPVFDGVVETVARPHQADAYVFSHSLDIEQAPEEMVADWRVRHRPVVLLSEEPFWDTIWGGKPLTRDIFIETRFGGLPVVQLNHLTSDIFHFDRIPYYLLTNHRFANAYRWRFRRNAGYSAADWKSDFTARKVDLTFMFERRSEPYHNVRFPDGDVIGLCAWRTELAQASTGRAVERLGQGWQDRTNRLELPDWHFEKIMELDRRSCTLSALENTHQPHYVTEKIFDAFACGSRPLYFASPKHRIHDFGLPETAWLNLYGLDPPEAAARAAQPFLNGEFLDAWNLAQTKLAALFGHTGAFVRERQRFGATVERALQQVLG